LTDAGAVELAVPRDRNGSFEPQIVRKGQTRLEGFNKRIIALLAGFVAAERRSRHALMPLRIFADRSRSGAYLVMLLTATAMFGIFFFLSLFVQAVLGYSALKSGLAFLPFAGTIVVVSAIVGQLIARTGARRLMLTGTAVTAGGMYWFSHISYLGGLLGPSLVTGVGLGLLFVPLSLVTLAGVHDEDSGLASSLLSTGQQAGGATGLAVLGTVAWTVVANSLHSQTAHAARAAAAAGRPCTVTSGPAAVGFYHQALAAGAAGGCWPHPGSRWARCSSRSS
jgi:predicted MFS family arabinose efflux permease